MKYDIILVHELAHEWFGNSITTEDLADKWIHEGFTGYAEILYLESRFGKQAANEYLIAKMKNIENNTPVIPRYNVNETGGADDFSKGRTIIHMMRQIMNDDKKFHQLLLDMNKLFYHKTTTSKEVEIFICKSTGIDFSKMFDQYLHTVQIPILEYYIVNNKIKYRYTNCIQHFAMPLKVNIKNEFIWLKPSHQWQELKVKDLSKSDIIDIDANFYVTAERKDVL
jgi:aminopeptidase N